MSPPRPPHTQAGAPLQPTASNSDGAFGYELRGTTSKTHTRLSEEVRRSSSRAPRNDTDVARDDSNVARGDGHRRHEGHARARPEERRSGRSSEAVVADNSGGLSSLSRFQLPQPSPPVLSSSSSAGYQVPQPAQPSGEPRSCRDRHRIDGPGVHAPIPGRNAITFGTEVTDLDKWTQHLASTLFFTNLAKEWALHAQLRPVWVFFRVNGCRTQANRFFKVECTSCNHYVYGEYDTYKTEDDRDGSGCALLQFLYVKEPTEVHV
jgi:hypothetical protein